jgi:hypothetical protein
VSTVVRQVADHLSDAIEKGRVAESQQIPSETVLTEHYGVARMTVRNAIGVLQAEEAGSRPEVDSIVIAEERPSRDISSRLGTTGKVLARHRRYLLDGQPVETAVSYIPLDIARGTPITEPNPALAASTRGLRKPGTGSTISMRKSGPGCPCPRRSVRCAYPLASRCFASALLVTFRRLHAAEGKGFEPLETRNASAVFKTAALGH